MIRPCNGKQQGVARLAEWVETDVDGAAEGALASEGVSSLTRRLAGRSITYFSVTELQCNSVQHDAT